MKTFNTKLIVPFVITLLLTGCMPDSLTKYKKDAPKKAAATATTSGTISSGPVTDSNGNLIVFDAPTYFTFTSLSNPVNTVALGTTATIPPLMDGSLGDTTKVEKFFEKCELVTSGVNSQATVLPSGISLDPVSCIFKGTTASTKSVTTAFCSDGVSTDQATCETNPLIWNSSTSTCSSPELQYANATACGAGFYKWYAIGDAIPYRVKLTYHNSSGLQGYLYTTMNLGVYKTLTTLSYSQADKVLLKVSANTALTGITPLLTSTATTGSYAKANMIVSSNDILSVGKYIDTTLNYIGVNKLLPIKVSSTTPFIINTFITKSGDASKVGRIFKIDSANRILYVENISANNATFLATESICPNTITGSCGTSYPIISISPSYIYEKNKSLDNDKQYYGEKYKISSAANVFEVGSLINPLSPIASTEISSTNGITYTISPSLPCNDPTDPTDCVAIDSTTGIISGTFSLALAATDFTVTATNPLGSVSKVVSISAIVGPSDLTLTSKQVITVSGTSSFREGETIYQPIVPPLTTAPHAKIARIINSYQMAIENFNGDFAPGASIDNNGSAYISEKAFVIPYSSCVNTNYTTQATCLGASFVWAPSAAVHYNYAITENSTGDYVSGDYINSLSGNGAGAIGIVAFVETAANDILYVQHLTQTATTTAASPTFYEGDTLDYGSTITQVDASNMKVTLASAASFVKGSDIVTSAQAAGYIYNKSGNILSINEISRSSTGTLLKAAQTLYNHETIALSTANSTINASSVTHDNYFIFERGKNMTLQGNVATGNGVIYSITPALPTGLALNTLTGSISGSSSARAAKKDYIITATNFIGSTTNVIALEVRDYFEVQDKSGASSFVMHKVGDYQNNRKCRVDSSDIASLSNTNALDIRCFLDGEEQDINQEDLKLNMIAGPGVCEYVQYSPYYFNAWSPAQSFETSSHYPTQAVIRSGCNSVTDTGTIPTVDLCEGNYGYYNTSYPNCDEGYLSYYNETYSSTCALTNRTKVLVSCGGAKTSCLAGPMKDGLSLTTLQLKNGTRSETLSAISGLEKLYTHTSPLNKGDYYTNVRNANGSINNQCLSSAADALTWKTKTTTVSKLASPLGSDSNPYYTVTCLDAAYEVKARIRVIVRDWDETFRITNNIYNQDIQSSGTWATQMNNSGTDMFGSPYNDILDWDDDFPSSTLGLKATFTGGSCGTHAAGSCTSVYSHFESNTQCTSVGGTVTTTASCSNASYTTKVTCEAASATWTNTSCNFANQYQCTLYGGVWTGDEEYKFPNQSSGNYLGL